jgi:N-acetylneuraminic acid mutarotase
VKLCVLSVLVVKNKMQKTLFISVLFLSFVSHAQTWQQITDFPSNERDDATGFVIGNTAYIGTGFLPWFAPSNDFYAFDFNTEVWSTITTMPALTERQYACGFSYQNFGFVFGGSNASSSLNDLYRYDTLTGNWTAMTSLPDTGRAGAGCFVIGDTAYIIGGKNSSVNATNEVWAYAILSDTWIQKNNLPNTGRWRSGATAVNGKGYLIFGRDKTGKFCDELYEYNNLIDAWTPISNFPGSKRNYSSLTALYDNLYVVAGIDTNNTYYNDLWTYDVSGNCWTNLASIPSFGRKGGTCVSSANSIYYSTGINSSNTRQKETWKILDPTTANEPVSHENIKVFPNPSPGIITIRTNLSQYHVKILAIDGQTVYSSTIGSNNCTLDLTNLAGGLYYLYLSNGIRKYTQKLIVK